MRSSVLVAFAVCVAACGGGGGAAIDGAAGTPDGATQPDGTVVDASSADGPADGLRVWRLDAPEVTPERAQSLAAALGFTGTTSEDPMGVKVVGARHGPAGPLRIEGVAGAIRLGDNRAISTRLGAACNDGVDDDGDGATDLADPDCTAIGDDDESVAGFQPRPVASVPILDGTITNGGTLTLSSVTLPALSGTTSSGGAVTGSVSTASGSGAIDPSARSASLDLTLEITITCAGAGCFTGSCVLSLPPITATTSAAGGTPYRMIDGHATVAATFSAPGVTSCAGGATTSEVNTLLGLPDTDASLVFGLSASPAFRDMAQVLEVMASSGAIHYADEEALNDLAAAPALLADADAQATASAFLAANGLLPPDAIVSVERELGADRSGNPIEIASVVVFTPTLDVTAQGPKVPVFGGEVVVLVGDLGRLVGLESRWRPATPLRTVAARFEPDVWAEVSTFVSSLTDPAFTLSLSHAYVSYPPEEEQRHYDPVHQVRDDEGTLAGYVPATEFTPRIELLGPDPSMPFDGSSLVPLRAGVTAGSPPYQLTWTSNLDGMLGTGLSLDASMSNGRHEIAVELRDANDAGYTLGFALHVTNSSMPAPAPDPLPGPAPPPPGKIRIPGGGWFLADRDEEPFSSPKVKVFNRRGNVVIEQVSVRQLRYELEVVTASGSGFIRSDRCFPALGIACPPAPMTPQYFGWGGTMLAPVVHTSGGVGTSQTIDWLPGTLDLVFNYRGDRVYCGPAPNRAELALMYVATGTTPVRQLGGTCAGFIPEVTWTYTPPAMGDLYWNVGSLWGYCFLSGTATNRWGERVCEVSQPDLDAWMANFNAPIVVRSIKVWTYTLVVPHGPSAYQVTTLAQDGATKLDLARTDGPLDSSDQPLLSKGDEFSQILPIQVEYLANATTTSGRGQWDNWHSKLWTTMPVATAGYHVSFPGGNDPRYRADNKACVHLHESWIGGPVYSVGQRVNWYVAVDKADERLLPESIPALVGLMPEPLFLFVPMPGAPNAGLAADSLLWHESIAKDTECGSPCRVFSSPLFFTH